jgi:nucleoside-diphosphate-sugar epimerase
VAMKVVITGSAGFIASNLTRKLLEQGYDVVGIDDLSTGFRSNLSALRTIGPGRFRFVERDINEPDLERDFDGAEVCFHLAALPRVSFSIDHPLAANEANVTGTLNVLEAARKAGVRRLVFSSSSSIYGGVAEFPTPETAKPSPKSPYALHKLTGEHYMRLYSDLHGLDTACLRYFNVMGQGQRTGGAYSTVIPAFFEAAIKGGSCRIDGDGNQSRDFCPVENVVQANILAALHLTPLNGQVFNVACGEAHTVNEVYGRICELSGKLLTRVDAPERKGDPRKSLADISKAQNILGYKAEVGFDESLKRTWDWWAGGCK